MSRDKILRSARERSSSVKERETKSGAGESAEAALNFVVNMSLDFPSQESLENEEDLGGRAQNLRRNRVTGQLCSFLPSSTHLEEAAFAEAAAY